MDKKNVGMINMTKGITLQELDSLATSQLVVKDSMGRAQVAAPATGNDIALKSTVDNAVGPLSGLLTTDKSNAVAAINELFTNVSDGKNMVASAISGKGVPASGSDTFAGLAGKIGQIQSRQFYETELSVRERYDRQTVSIPFSPNVILIFAVAHVYPDHSGGANGGIVAVGYNRPAGDPFSSLSQYTGNILMICAWGENTYPDHNSPLPSVFDVYKPNHDGGYNYLSYARLWAFA